MAKSRDIENASSDLNNNLERDFNDFIRSALLELSSEFNSDGGDPVSPIDTGFFVSSCTASTQRPRPNQDRMDFAPWKDIEPTRKGEKSPQAEVNPRFINDIKFNFKPFSKVFIGNRSEYAARALASPRSQIPRFVQNDLKDLVNAIFTDKKPQIAIATKPFKGGTISPTGTKGIGQFADPDRTFVDYTNL